VQLAHTVFHADQVSMWLSDLGLSPAFRNLAIEHGEYFRSRERLDKLKAVIKKDDTPEQLRGRMIYLACGNTNSLTSLASRGLKTSRWNFSKHISPPTLLRPLL
jgi:hypothetical protein